MVTATHDDIARLFPGMQDHAITDVLAMGATVNELEAAMLLLQGNDEELIEIKNQKGSRLNILLDILSNSEIQLRDELDT